MNPAVAMWLWWLMWTTSAECTRCGGQHTLSRCPWPAAYKERNEG